MVLLLAAVACRPESYRQRAKVLVPQTESARQGPPTPGPSVLVLEDRVEMRVQVPPGSSPPVLRAHPDTVVLVPADGPLPAWMRWKARRQQ
jgi:hypothetical protein